MSFNLKRMTVKLIFGLFAIGAAWGQNDVLTLEGGVGNAQEEIVLGLYFRDVPGTLIDTGVSAFGYYSLNFKATYDADLVDSITFVRAGLSASVSPAVFFDGSSEPGITGLVSAFNNQIAFTLGSAAPGDLFAQLKITPSAQAAGRTITFTVDPINTNMASVNGNDEISPSNGLLTVTTGTITVMGVQLQPPVINSFTANPSTITRGQNAELSWSVSDADTVVLQPGNMSLGASGSLQVSPQTTTQYTLTATNSDGTDDAQVTVTVNDPPPEILSFTATPATITVGESSMLAWSVEGADTVVLNPGSQTVAAMGSLSVMPESTTLYTLTATNGSGQVSSEVTVTVLALPAPEILSFTSAAAQILAGGSTTLSWDVANANDVSIQPGIGTVSPTGTRQISPVADTTYTLSATNATGTVTADVSVEVLPPMEIVSFDVSPNQIVAEETATLSWEVTNADTTTINGDPVATSGTMDVMPAATTTYTLTAFGPLGQELQQTVMLTVSGEPSLRLDSGSLNLGETQVEGVVMLSSNTTVEASWTLGQLPSWLSAMPTSGTVSMDSPVAVTFSADRDQFFPGQLETALAGFEATGLNATQLNVTASRPRLANENYLYFPLLEDNDQTISEIVVVNLGQDAVEAIIQVFDAAGQAVLPTDVVSLNPNASRRYAVTGLNGQTGWAVATLRPVAPENGRPVGSGAAIVRSTDGEELVALSAEPAPADFLYLPHIAGDTSTFFTTTSVVNLFNGNRQSSVDVTINGVDGGNFAIADQDKGAQAYFQYEDLLGDLLQPQNAMWGTVSFTPEQGTSMIGAEVFGYKPRESGERRRVGVGLNQQASQVLYFTHVAKDLVNFWTGVVIINLADSEADIQFEVFDEEGQILDTLTQVTFAPGEKRTFVSLGDRQDMGVGAAWLRVTSPFPMMGYELFASPTFSDWDMFAGIESLGTLSNRLLFPHTEDGLAEGGFTGISIINPSNSIANTTLSLVSSEGLVKMTAEEPINPNQKLVRLASVLFPEVSIEPGDIILVEADQNIAGFQLFGAGITSLGAVLAYPY